MVELDRGIPIPRKMAGPRHGRPAKYPFSEMKIGDSFLAAGTPATRSYLYTRALKLGLKLTSRMQPDGKWRVWRIA